MSRGLGREQRVIMKTLGKTPYQERPLHILKQNAWGYGTVKVPIMGCRKWGLVWWREDADGVSRKNYDHVFKRSLVGLVKRGLVSERKRYFEWRKTPQLCYRLTEQGLQELKRLSV